MSSLANARPGRPRRRSPSASPTSPSVACCRSTIRAADHFFALTILLAYNEQPDPSTVDIDRVRRTMADGVEVFLRAYRAP